MSVKDLKYLAVTGVLVALGLNYSINTIQVMQKTKRLKDLQERVGSLEGARSELENEVKFRLSTEFIEQEARNKLGLVKPGEEVYLKPKIVGDLNLGSGGDDSGVLGSENGVEDGSEGKSASSGVLGFLDKLKGLLLTFTGSKQQRGVEE